VTPRAAMLKAVQFCIGFAFLTNVLVIVVTLTSSGAKGEEVLSPAAQRGLVIVRANCSRCHAIGRIGASPLPIAPPFRTLHERYPVDDLKSRWPKGSSPAIRLCQNFASIPDKSETSLPI
jgi:cytochrome c